MSLILKCLKVGTRTARKHIQLQYKNLFKKMSENCSKHLGAMDVPESVKRPIEPTNAAWVKRIRIANVNNTKELIEEEDRLLRRKLRKYVLMLSYSGKGYLGMQKNVSEQTIEDELLKAMHKCNLIQEEGCSVPQLYRFQRAARTDKGVSAARQIVSLKLPDDVNDIPGEINKYLPSQIQVMKCVRVTQKFDAKLQCDSRTYSYTSPSFAFAPIDQIVNEDYRISEEALKSVRDVLLKYKGTHKFHNFTSKVKAEDANAFRYIMEISCSEPFVREGIEFVRILIKGQSFMLHQIRKMVGLGMALCRGVASEHIFTKVWQRDRCDIPIAPGLGLVLEEPHYFYYNRRYGGDGMHELLEWSGVEDEVQKFREKFIDSTIVEVEKSEKSMLKWLEMMAKINVDVRVDDNNLTGMTRAAFQIQDANKDSEEKEEENQDKDINEADDSDVNNTGTSVNIDKNEDNGINDDQKTNKEEVTTDGINRRNNTEEGQVHESDLTDGEEHKKKQLSL